MQEPLFTIFKWDPEGEIIHCQPGATLDEVESLPFGEGYGYCKEGVGASELHDVDDELMLQDVA